MPVPTPDPDSAEAPPRVSRDLILAGIAAALVGSLLLFGIAGFFWTTSAQQSGTPQAQLTPPGDPSTRMATTGDGTPSGLGQTPVPVGGGPARDPNLGVLPRPGGDGAGVLRMVDFMGSRASGRQVCIIADCSGSMSRNRRMLTLQEEIQKTLEALHSDQRFYVIFFDSRAEEMPAKKWLSGGSDVASVLPWVRSRKPRGGTQPAPAFQIAFRLDPRPDLIFFMTDGIIPRNVPTQVAQLNDKASPKIVINSILFGGEGEARSTKGKKPLARVLLGEDQLRKLADDSGGTYRFVADKSAK